VQRVSRSKAISLVHAEDGTLGDDMAALSGEALANHVYLTRSIIEDAVRDFGIGVILLRLVVGLASEDRSSSPRTVRASGSKRGAGWTPS
jgi:hypothetical protein